MSPNAQNEIQQIMAVIVLRDIASDITESGYYIIMTVRALMLATLNSL